MTTSLEPAAAPVIGIKCDTFVQPGTIPVSETQNLGPVQKDGGRRLTSEAGEAGGDLACATEHVSHMVAQSVNHSGSGHAESRTLVERCNSSLAREGAICERQWSRSVPRIHMPVSSEFRRRAPPLADPVKPGPTCLYTR